MIKKLFKNKSIIYILIASLFVCSVGFSFAYYVFDIVGQDTVQKLSTRTALVKLTYSGSEAITSSNIIPDDENPFATQTLIVENELDSTTYYGLYWNELLNEFTRTTDSSVTALDEISISATCVSYTNYGTASQAVSGTCDSLSNTVPTQSTQYTYDGTTIDEDYIIAQNIEIGTGITHVYSISLYFNEMSYSQNHNLNKTFSGKIAAFKSEAETIVTVKSSLSEYSWSEIKTLSDALVAGTITTSELSSTFNINIGDTTASVSITPSGGSTESHTFRLVGLNHDVDASGNTLGMTFEQIDLMNNTYVMKSSPTSSDSWDNSDLKTTINNFTLPSDLNSVITSAKKPCVTSVTNSTLTYVTSKLWIMSETEIAGTNTYTYGDNVSEGTQYAYYQTNNTATDRLKQKSGSNYYYWLRSAYDWDNGDEGSIFASVYNYGSVYYGNSYDYGGVSVCFCI